MKAFLHVMLAALLCTAGCGNAPHADKPQDHAAFVAALHNESTSPSFVKFQAAGTGQPARTYCTSANFLLGAIHLEQGLPYTEEGLAVSTRAATSNTDHVFRFDKPAALANLPEPPTGQDRKEAAALFEGRSDARIRESLMTTEVLGFYRDSPRRQQRMSAVACALIDLGYEPQMADIVAAVVLPPP